MDKPTQGAVEQTLRERVEFEIAYSFPDARSPEVVRTAKRILALIATPDEGMVELGCRASATAYGYDPDMLIGSEPLWKSYERGVRAALTAALGGSKP